MRRGAIVGFSFCAWTAGIVATSSERNLLESGISGNLLPPDLSLRLVKLPDPDFLHGSNPWSLVRRCERKCCGRLKLA